MATYTLTSYGPAPYNAALPTAQDVSEATHEVVRGEAIAMADRAVRYGFAAHVVVRDSRGRKIHEVSTTASTAAPRLTVRPVGVHLAYRITNTSAVVTVHEQGFHPDGSAVTWRGRSLSEWLGDIDRYPWCELVTSYTNVQYVSEAR